MASGQTQVFFGPKEGGPQFFVPTQEYNAQKQQIAQSTGDTGAALNNATNTALTGKNIAQEEQNLTNNPNFGKTFGILDDVLQAGMGLATGGLSTLATTAENTATGQETPIQGLEGVGGSVAGSQLGGLAGDAAGGGNLGALAGAVSQSGANAGLAELSGGNVNPISTLAAGLSGAAGGAGATGSTSDASVSDAPQGTPINGGETTPISSGDSVSLDGGESTPVSGGNSTSILGGDSTPVSGGNIGSLTSGLSASVPNAGTGSSNNISGNNVGALTAGLKDASAIANIGQSLQNLLQGLSTGYGSGNIVTGTNEISTPVTAAEAASITPTGSWTDRQLYDALQAIQQRYAGTGQGNSPQEQAEIQALLSQQVG